MNLPNLGSAARSGLAVALLGLAACGSPDTGGKGGELDGPALIAEVVDLHHSPEIVPYMRAEVRFRNPGSKPRKIRRFVLSWPGGRKVAVPGDPLVPPAASAVTQVKIGPQDGDLAALRLDSVHVDVDAR